MAHVGKQPRGSALLVKHRDARDVTGRPPTVPAKIRAAAELLCAQPSTLDYGALAKQVGYGNAKALRQALALPQSARFLRDYRRERIEHLRMANPEALREIRDESEIARARVQAVRTLEAEEADRQGGARAGQIAPGMVIVIEQRDRSTMTIGPAQPPVIEHEPYDEASTD